MNQQTVKYTWYNYYFCNCPFHDFILRNMKIRSNLNKSEYTGNTSERREKINRRTVCVKNCEGK